MKPWLIFDFDGTVVDSVNKIRQLINRLAQRYHFDPITPERFQLLRDLPFTKAARLQKVPLWKLGRMALVVLDEYRQIIPDLEPCAGILPTLAELKALGISLALISSNHTQNLRAWLEHHQLDCFDWVEGTSGILRKHDNIKGQIHRHGLDNDDVIYVGDEARDIKAARKSGIRIISVCWGLHSEAYLQSLKPDHLVREPAEIALLAKQLLIGEAS